MNSIITRNRQTPMETLLGIDEKGMTNARKLYEFLQLDSSNFSRWSKTNIDSNEYAIENEDYLRVVIDDETPTGGKLERVDYRLAAAFAKKLAMKANNLRGEEARDYYVNVENSTSKLTQSLSNLSPELKALIGIELKQQELDMRLEDQNLRIEAQSKRLDIIRETIIGDAEDEVWRQAIKSSKNRIVNATGRSHQEVTNESYKALESQGGCNLNIRLSNLRDRLVRNGEGKTKVNNACKLDCIESDKKLKAIYTRILREMSIRYTA